MSKKNDYRVEFRPINVPMNFNKNGDIGEVSVVVKAYSISEAMTVANSIVAFASSDPHEISCVNLMFSPRVRYCDEDGD